MKISNYEIKRGEHKILKLFAGRLPSDTQIPIHVHVYRSLEPGPVMLVVGGMHGDEINGVEILRKSIHKGIYNELNKGTVVVIPLLNIYGFINFSRDLPDGKDVNRSFPGSANGSLARRVAHKLTKEILDQVDFSIDFHTGSNSRYNYPQVRYTPNDLQSLELAKAFGPPIILQKPMIKGSFRAVANKRGKPAIVYEGGEALRWDELAITEGIKGIQSLMNHFGMTKRTPSPKNEIKYIIRSSWTRAHQSGLFTWYKSSGTKIDVGEILGIITDPNGQKVHMIISKMSGLIIGHNNAAVVNVGDALFHIGQLE